MPCLDLPPAAPEPAPRPGRPGSVSCDQALRLVLDAVSPLAAQSVPILEAEGRVLAQDVVSDVMLPPFPSSARDGYAVIAADTQGASLALPVSLRVLSEIRAGGSSSGRWVAQGAAVRIMTGAPLPVGADAVVQFEDTAEAGGVVRVFSPVRRYENYRHPGENIGRGDLVLRRGERLNPADVGILASLNHDQVTVHRQPLVAIVSTGDELAGMGEAIAHGQIRDVNAYALYAEAKRYGALPAYLGIAKDDKAEIKALFGRAMASDVVISTGGGSMGRYDFVKEVYAELGIQMLFERVNLKPGKPCAFGVKGNQLFFSLPGNPVSALTTFIQFVRPALLRLMGANRIAKPVVSAVLLEDIAKKRTQNRRLLRGRFTIQDGQFRVSTMGDQKPSIFQTMREANCLIIVPENVERIRAGEQVLIQLIYHDEV
ncbi:MAG: gephyrin-like molybdotransferase Glp [Pseudomonadota bacterium]